MFPDEIWLYILSFLNRNDILQWMLVNKQLYHLSRDDILWKQYIQQYKESYPRLHIKSYYEAFKTCYCLDKIKKTVRSKASIPTIYYTTYTLNLIKYFASANHIPKVLRYANVLKNLREITIKNCSDVPETLFNIRQLQVLNLQSNQLTNIHDNISQLTDLTKLDLSDNRIRDFPKSVYKLPCLLRLYLDNNDINEIPADITQLTNLEELWLAKNKINKFTDEITKLTQLQELKLTDDIIIPDYIKKLSCISLQKNIYNTDDICGVNFGL